MAEDGDAPSRFVASALASAPGRTGRGGAYIRLDHRAQARLLATVWRVRYDCTPPHAHVTSSDLRVEAKSAPGRRGHSQPAGAGGIAAQGGVHGDRRDLGSG